MYSPECDVNEKVLSDPRDPRFGDEAARFECSEFIAQTVDDEVEDIWWKGARHLRCVFGVDYRCWGQNQGRARSHPATRRTLTRHELEIQTDPDGPNGRSGEQAPTQPSSRIGGFFTRVHKYIPEPLVHSLPLAIPEFIQNQGVQNVFIIEDTPAASTRVLDTITRSKDADNNAGATVDISCFSSAPMSYGGPAIGFVR